MLDLIINSDLSDKKTEYELLKKQNTTLLDRAKKGEERYKDAQDWFDVRICAGEAQLERIEKKAAEIRANADAFVLIGIGGSNNAARAVIEAIAPKTGCPVIYAGNTLNPYAINQMLESLEGKDFYIDCIAKNFETLEPGASFRILRQLMEKKYGDKAKDRILATGTPGSSLWKLCQEEGYDFFEFPVHVGGRYTAMTNVGLLPMAVAGIDIRALVKGAYDMQVRLHEEEAEENIAYTYAALRNLFYQEGYRVEMLSSFEPRLHYFYLWWRQLFAESEGKDNRGIFPVTGEFTEELHSIGQYIQDGAPILFESFLHIRKRLDSPVIQPDHLLDHFDYLDGKDFDELNRAAFQATVKAHSRKLPVLTFEIEQLDAYHFGALFYFFQFACYLSCEMMGVNPFNQPGVEAYKHWMFEALGK